MKQNGKCTLEHIMDVPIPLIQKEILKVVKIDVTTPNVKI